MLHIGVEATLLNPVSMARPKALNSGASSNKAPAFFVYINGHWGLVAEP